METFLFTFVACLKTQPDISRQNSYQRSDIFKGIDKNAVSKIIWNLDLAERTNDSKLFKKLRDEIWEFRTKYGNLQYRRLAFWNKSSSENFGDCSSWHYQKQTRCLQRKLKKP